MCPKDPIFLLKVSNLGSAVRSIVFDKEWAVTLPQMLQDRGPCFIRVIQGRIQGDNDQNIIPAKIWVESNIPIMGCSTEVFNSVSGSAQYSELFDVNCTDIGHSDTTSQSVITTAILRPITFRMQHPQSFRCNGLPNMIQFCAKVMTAANIAQNMSLVTPTISYLVDSYTVYPVHVEFHLEIIFDRDL